MPSERKIVTDRTDDSASHAEPVTEGPHSPDAQEDSGPRLARSTMASHSRAVDDRETDGPVPDAPGWDALGAQARTETQDVDEEDADLARDSGHGDAEGQVSARSHVNTHNASLRSAHPVSGTSSAVGS